jgi:hypothetical protein
MHPLREEVEAIVETDGWSKEALAKMRKLDSFLKKSQRMDGISCGKFASYCTRRHSSPTLPVSMSRKVMKDFTLSDGTVLPQGTIVTIASQATRLDSGYYENADVFDPFRFAKDGDDAKHSFVSTNPDYLAFGHGRHAWYECLSISTSYFHDGVFIL